LPANELSVPEETTKEIATALISSRTKIAMSKAIPDSERVLRIL